MNAGILDTRIQLQRKDRTVKASGAEGGSWVTTATVWAQMVPLEGREAFQAQQRFAEATTKFVLRFRKGFTPIDRIVLYGREFDVLEVLALPGGRPDRLEILAKARAE